MDALRSTLGDASAKRCTASSPPSARDRESGQAMVEFALILMPFLLLVGGIIYFGIGLNYWLDTQRLANQGARWAVVNEYPGCPRTGPGAPCSPTLQQLIACDGVADGLKPTVDISFPSTTIRGNPVTVVVSTPFTMLPILNIGTITLKGEATMRIEQNASRYAAGSYTPVSCP